MTSFVMHREVCKRAGRYRPVKKRRLRSPLDDVPEQGGDRSRVFHNVKLRLESEKSCDYFSKRYGRA